MEQDLLDAIKILKQALHRTRKGYRYRGFRLLLGAICYLEKRLG